MSEQNPYGSPAQPYGAPPPAQPQAFGPPQPPAYGAPPQPYGAVPPQGGPQPYPAGAGYPGYAPQPQRKSRKGLWVVLGCVGGALLLGGGLLGYFVYDTASKTGTHKVVLPATFKGMSSDPDEPTAKQLSESMDSAFSQGNSAWTPTESVSSIYRTDTGTEAVVVAGAWGNVVLPSTQVDAVFKGAATEGTISNRKDVDPGPLGGRMSCAEGSNLGQKFGFCAWADGSTVMMVMEVKQGATTIDVDKVASDARELRQTAEVPK
ncbi:hypothetical protein [Kitasatospora camelliae]|uniref:Uncharacterized protein n=1 Tax=Kitasatospora camelliae TaxID=3156397 RepID=A0AAU8JWB6_9ACTN